MNKEDFDKLVVNAPRVDWNQAYDYAFVNGYLRALADVKEVLVANKEYPARQKEKEGVQ